MTNLCAICGTVAPARWVFGKEGDPLVTANLCSAHARPFASTLSAIQGEDEAAVGFTEVLQQRVTTLEDLAYRKRIGAA